MSSSRNRPPRQQHRAEVIWDGRAKFEEKLRMAQRWGVDLIQVSVHSNTCDVCRRVQGKVYSISGRSRDFPKLNFRLPLHEGCRHLILPVVADSLMQRGQYWPLSRFSKSNDEVLDLPHYRETLKRYADDGSPGSIRGSGRSSAVAVAD